MTENATAIATGKYVVTGQQVINIANEVRHHLGISSTSVGDGGINFTIDEIPTYMRQYFADTVDGSIDLSDMIGDDGDAAILFQCLVSADTESVRIYPQNMSVGGSTTITITSDSSYSSGTDRYKNVGRITKCKVYSNSGLSSQTTNSSTTFPENAIIWTQLVIFTNYTGLKLFTVEGGYVKAIRL